MKKAVSDLKNFKGKKNIIEKRYNFTYHESPNFELTTELSV